jgi:hypothetical protein
MDSSTTNTARNKRIIAAAVFVVATLATGQLFAASVNKKDVEIGGGAAAGGVAAGYGALNTLGYLDSQRIKAADNLSTDSAPDLSTDSAPDLNTDIAPTKSALRPTDIPETEPYEQDYTLDQMGAKVELANEDLRSTGSKMQYRFNPRSKTRVTFNDDPEISNYEPRGNNILAGRAMGDESELLDLQRDASGDAAKTGDVESTAGEDLDKVSSGLDANVNDLNTATSTAEQAEGATTGVDTLTGLEGSASGETVGSEAGELIEDSLDLG